MRMLALVCGSTPGAIRRRGLALIAAMVVGGIAVVADAQTCPSADPNQNYNCPIGPIYATPGWGNVPWSAPQYYQSIQAGDLDGDGRDELIGRDARGFHVWSFASAEGVWKPWLASAGGRPLVLGLTDANQWNLPQYYSGMQLIDLAGQAGKVLAVRSANGLLMYRLSRGSDVLGLPAGTWGQLSSEGPFPDSSDCSLPCWNEEPYFSTIRFGDIDGQPGDEAIGWASNGIVAYKWTGSSWTQLAGIPGAGDADSAIGATSTLLADLDGQPGEELVVWTPAGVVAYKYLAASDSWTTLPTLAAFGACNLDSSCFSSLRAAPFGAGPAAVFIRLPGCSAAGGGMTGARYDSARQAWTTLFTGGPFDDCAGFGDGEEYYATIQLAKITGAALPELVGRGPGGILLYQWNGVAWTALSTNTPALADPVWAADPSYYKTIQTANVDSSGRAALIARGQTGVRTWLWQGAALARPQAYGGFPPFAGDQGVAYGLLNSFLGLAGTIRDTYTDPAVDNSSDALRGYVAQIVNARNGCQNEVSANPPQYQTCDPLVGTSNPAYTTMVNQVIKELWWAASVVDYFGSIQRMQNELFTTQNSSFPSLAGNLQIQDSDQASAVSNYLNLFATIATLVSAIVGLPEIGIAADAVAVAASSVSTFANPSGSSFMDTYAQIQTRIAGLQSDMQTAIPLQKHHVLADYPLLSTIGQLTASQAWTVDEAGYLSINRQAFALWVYQGFLPLLWTRYEVTGCMEVFAGCTPPELDLPNIATQRTYTGTNGATTVDFVGLLPDTVTNCVSGTNGSECDFPASVDPNQRAMVFSPVSAQCTYNPQAGTAWVYAEPSSNPPIAGCTLGVSSDPNSPIFTNQGGWNIPVVELNLLAGQQAFEVDRTSRATRIGSDHGRLQLNGSARPGIGNLDLRSVRLTLQRLLHEAHAGGELVGDSKGVDFVPMPLQADRRATARRATFRTPVGQSPRVTADVSWQHGKHELSLAIDVEGTRIGGPQRCLDVPGTTKLHLAIALEGGGLPAPLTLSQVADWECIFDRRGNVKSLRYVGNPVYQSAGR